MAPAPYLVVVTCIVGVFSIFLLVVLRFFSKNPYLTANFATGVLCRVNIDVQLTLAQGLDEGREIVSKRTYQIICRYGARRQLTVGYFSVLGRPEQERHHFTIFVRQALMNVGLCRIDDMVGLELKTELVPCFIQSKGGLTGSYGI